MKVLLDTCTFIGLCSDPDKFSPPAQAILSHTENLELFLSDASIFEIALKSSIGKMELPEPPRKWVTHQLEVWGIQSLPISHEELFISAELPWHHKDPFDRLILATAKNHELPIMTPDGMFPSYDIEVIGS